MDYKFEFEIGDFKVKAIYQAFPPIVKFAFSFRSADYISEWKIGGSGYAYLLFKYLYFKKIDVTKFRNDFSRSNAIKVMDEKWENTMIEECSKNIFNFINDKIRECGRNFFRLFLRDKSQT